MPVLIPDTSTALASPDDNRWRYYDYGSENYGMIDRMNALGQAGTYAGYSASDIGKENVFNKWLEKQESLAATGDTAAIDRLWNYYSSERSAMTARDWTAAREDTAYQRLVKDLEKAGISPYVISSASPNVSASTGNSYSGNPETSKYKTDQDNKRQYITSLLKLLMSAAGLIASTQGG